MKAKINGIEIEGTPQEIAEYVIRTETKLEGIAKDGLTREEIQKLTRDIQQHMKVTMYEV